jgi:hypothetical protein
MSLRISIVVAFALAACLIDSPVLAQQRPYRALFGGTSAEDGDRDRHSLDWSSSLFSGWDQNVLAADRRAGGQRRIDPRFQRRGVYWGAHTGLAYLRPGLVSLAASAGLSWRYYPGIGNWTSSRHAASAAFSTGLARRTRLSLRQSVGYAPRYTFGFFPALVDEDIGDDLLLPDDDFVVLPRKRYSSTSSAGLNHALGRTSSIDLSYAFRWANFLDDDLARRAHRARVQYRRGVTRHAGMRFGYGYQEALYARNDHPIRTHSLDIGMDYGRWLSLTRRTSLGFGTGSTLVGRQREDVERGLDTRRTRFVATGSASLLHQIGRSWQAQASYARRVRFIDGFADPVLYDSAAATIGGYLNRRVRVSGVGAYSSGRFGLGRADNRLGVYTASGQVDVGLTRHMALYSQIFYYRYRLGAEVRLPEGLEPSLERSGVRVGLTTWVPLLR